ncbi:1-phosphofructokinase [Zophobihabitans entericus]|uniref:Phosphofructokinase n=1 Tax=Zophobihabitans entericus TaxID=1635327 RepID=A0A6G9IBM3_9GAMM|nr:1-phosphofructokinase [Zophobihabitans entericus]QIQ21635.1 1-phosphofructokinase [Zophobihabitans entericus]
MSYKVATITLNPAYDLVGFCPAITLGDVNLVQTTGLHAAGKGINVAKVLHDLGINCTVTGLLGLDNQDGFKQLFEQLGLDNKFQTVEGRTRINVKLTEADNDVTDLNFSGFTVSPAAWQQFTQHSLALLKHMDMVSINGSLPAGIELGEFTSWMEAVKTVCPKVVFDSSRDALKAGMMTLPWLIKPNEKELSQYAGKTLTTIDELKATAKELVGKGVEHVIVSMGPDGALWITKNESWHAKPPSCPIVSTVGAGDSMVAGLMYGLLTGMSIKDVLKLASAIAALSVSQTNVGISDKQVLDQMIEKIAIREI